MIFICRKCRLLPPVLPQRILVQNVRRLDDPVHFPFRPARHFPVPEHLLAERGERIEHFPGGTETDAQILRDAPSEDLEQDLLLALVRLSAEFSFQDPAHAFAPAACFHRPSS